MRPFDNNASDELVGGDRPLLAHVSLGDDLLCELRLRLQTVELESLVKRDASHV